MYSKVLNKILLFVWVIMLIGTCAFSIDEYSSAIDPMLDASSNTAQPTNATKVTAVYGVGSDDYLPLKEEARRQLRPNVRESQSHPVFDLPDAFYFVGGPVFMLILLRVLWMFLVEFEEKRKEEQNKAASEKLPGEGFADK